MSQRAHFFLPSSWILAAVIAMVALLSVTFTATLLPLRFLSFGRLLTLNFEGFLYFFCYFDSVLVNLFNVISPVFFVDSVVFRRVGAIGFGINLKSKLFLFFPWNLLFIFGYLNRISICL